MHSQYVCLNNILLWTYITLYINVYNEKRKSTRGKTLYNKIELNSSVGNREEWDVISTQQYTLLYLEDDDNDGNAILLLLVLLQQQLLSHSHHLHCQYNIRTYILITLVRPLSLCSYYCHITPFTPFSSKHGAKTITNALVYWIGVVLSCMHAC